MGWPDSIFRHALRSVNTIVHTFFVKHRVLKVRQRLPIQYNGRTDAPSVMTRTNYGSMKTSPANKPDDTRKKPARRLTPDEFRMAVLLRGWTYRSLAERWNMSENWISKLARNPERPLHYDDALNGLPKRQKGRENASGDMD